MFIFVPKVSLIFPEIFPKNWGIYVSLIFAGGKQKKESLKPIYTV